MNHNYTKTTLKTSYGAHKRVQADKHKRSLLIGFIIFMKWLIGMGLLMLLATYRLAKALIDIKVFTSHDDKRYYNPTTNCSAVKPNRHSLAIFMSKICLTNYQRFINDINTNISALQTSHKYSIDTIGANIYDGLSGPNKIPLVGNKPRRLNTVVNNLSPFFLGGNKLTNCSGAILHG